jgi:hypothetical protein
MYKKRIFDSLKNIKNPPAKRLSELIIAILVAFACGNMFGMYTKTIAYPEFIICSSIFIVELISFLKYSLMFGKNESLFFFLLNAIKRGFLIGLFVEAFKLGS